MSRTLSSAVAAAVLLAVATSPAKAASVDASTLTCKDLADKNQSSEKTDQFGASIILYWMAGYHATDEQGAVVDFDNMLKEFGKTIEFCGQNPAIGVMTASLKYMGENSAAASTKAIDLAIIKCEQVNNTKDDETDGLAQIMMWLAGYHTSLGEDTMIDMEAFGKSVEQIAVYCVENPAVGLFSASQKFMGSDDEDPN